MIRSSLFKEVFEQSSVPQMLSTFDMSVNIGNRAFYDYLGYSKEEWEQLSVKDISHPEDFVIDEQLMGEMKQGVRSHYQIEKRYFHKLGMILTATLTVSLIRDPETNERYYFAQINDCTDQYAIEQSLRKSEQKYRLLAEHSSDIIMLHDVNGTYQYISPSVESIIGYKPAEMLGTLPYDYVHQDDIQTLWGNHQKLLKNEETLQLVTYRVRKKDGSFSWLETSIKGVYDEETGELTELISVSRDIQKRIETDELLRKSEKLAVVGQMAAAVAHEIRNPLTPIKGFMTLLSKTKEYNPMYIEIILSELKRIELIITEFLSMAKPHHKKWGTIYLDQLVVQVSNLLQSEAIMDNKEIILDIQNKIPRIIGDENSLKQVVVNVMRNALESLNKNGKVKVTLYKEEGYICIKVVDNGCGISDERLTKIGEPFYSTKEKGTGLGLMTSYQIIQNHNGKMDIKSKEGEGTTVIISMPIKYKTRL
ncbi:PAS domain S-box protein [Neobacillus sp. D3-1R]|uniref:PAS domain S-box protein n=1 Tax=Neobacillus sp. D3-1R TaxID=3445778 RepID=UPI003FA0579F